MLNSRSAEKEDFRTRTNCIISRYYDFMDAKIELQTYSIFRKDNNNMNNKDF